MAIGTFPSITLTVGQTVPEITLTGSTLVDTTAMTLVLPGVTTAITGTFVSGKFRPTGFGTASAQIVPVATLTGYRSITLNSASEPSSSNFVMILLLGAAVECAPEESFVTLPDAPLTCSAAEFAKLKVCLVGKTITIDGAGLITNIV
jgi:hypothetical protein